MTYNIAESTEYKKYRARAYIFYKTRSQLKIQGARMVT
jgi:hypothetical protein